MEAAVRGADILVVAPTGMGKVRFCILSDAKADVRYRACASRFQPWLNR
jgi:hypothetical protein